MYTQAAEEALASALEENHEVTCLTVDLRSTRARDFIAKFLLRNQVGHVWHIAAAT